MTTSLTIRGKVQEVALDSPKRCIHCSGGWVYESTEDPLEDEAYWCHMCLGTGRTMSSAERKAERQ